ncbi:hypothetical protein [Streptomyces sp. NPDC048445]|uniref:hypothetical protein n=1 Tax=Streptomyces sp. NPDC048445 TaxID=3365553 RepID=UPI003724B57C
MSADTIFSLDPSSTTPEPDTLSDGDGGGAGRGGSQNGSQGPLVVVQQPRGASPPRPAPRQSRGNADNSLRNGYAAISHSVSGETAAIGAGFLLGGPVGAVIGGLVAPAAAAAVMWRSRRREHDENTNQNGAGAGNPGRGSSGNGHGTGGRNGARADRNNSPGGGRHRTPNTNGSGNSNGRGGADGVSNHRKPKTKDPVADKLGKLGKDLASKLKNKRDKDGASKNEKTTKGGSAKGLRGGLRDGLKLKDRGKQPGSNRVWRDRGDKGKKKGSDNNVSTSSARDGLDPKRPKGGDGKDKGRKKRGKDDDASAATARDGLAPKDPKGPESGGGDLPPKPEYEPDEYIEAELVDDLPPKPETGPEDVIDGEAIDEDRIAAVRAKREKKLRREALAAGRKAAGKAARNGAAEDPRRVKVRVTRQANHAIDLEVQREDHLLALTKAAETPRSTPVNYPAIQAAPVGTSTAGVAIARHINVRGTTAYAILRAMAEQIAHGLHSDDDADMADHVVELTGIPNMCKNLSTAVQEAARALARTAPLHPSVIKHLNNAAVAARTAGVMAENIMVVFVQAHREDIIRVLDPRIGEERWNIRNAPGTLDAAKLRAAIASANTARLALPGGSSSQSTGGQGGSKLVPASDGSTKKLINLMKNFNSGHMVNVLSEVAGSAAGVDAVAESIGKLYRRMQKTWPTENVVDDTVIRTAGQVRRVSTELRKAIKAAQKAHQRELRLNATGRASKGARAERKWDVVGRRGSSGN